LQEKRSRLCPRRKPSDPRLRSRDPGARRQISDRSQGCSRPHDWSRAKL